MDIQNPILLFDGICNLCNKLVIFIIHLDKKAKIKFSPLQSPEATSLLLPRGISAASINSIVFIDGNGYYLKSSAILHLFKVLGGGWSIIYGLIIFPRFIRDYFYDLISKSRYRIFGRSETCMIPPSEIKERFL
jgi:predicted DCC family thiol-disulfide oxidoreductase YuxK